MTISTREFGRLDGQPIVEYTLTNGAGVSVRVMSFGAIVTSVETPDRTGRPAEITLGFDSFDSYLAGHPFFGAVAGRFANRIARGRFTLNGTEYRLAVNDGPNHLHGGLRGFDKQVYAADIDGEQNAGRVIFTRTSPDGEEGYPGKLDVEIAYVLSEANELRIEYTAHTTRPTPINLTNHAYWNLESGGSITDHRLELLCDAYLPVDDTQIPTGEIREVAATPFDFRTPKRIGDEIDDVGGYDHCFVISGKPDASGLRTAARLIAPSSGRVMELSTTKPAVQFYTGNKLTGLATRIGKAHARTALCLETQYYPDAVNHPNFPSAILSPGETYRHTTVYRFSTEQ